MEPKEKAKELVEKFLPYVDWMDLIDDCTDRKSAVRNAKNCALITVNEILGTDIFSITESYWKEIKIQIENYE